MSVEPAIGLILCLAALGYLLAALIDPERFS
ncbi:hypothetical protein USB125703_00565 [Pseudoclavibacter triregionum]|nr:hypothetical protein USB125703_00565 [Pseudoclavibacter triregionum]